METLKKPKTRYPKQHVCFCFNINNGYLQKKKDKFNTETADRPIFDISLFVERKKPHFQRFAQIKTKV